MSPFVDLQVLRTGEQLATTGERTGKRFLARVDAKMIYQFVFRFEREPGTRTLFPVADVFRGIVESDVIFREMLHDVHHDEELFSARFSFRHLIRPHARDDLVERLSEIPVRLISTHVHVTVRVVSVIVVRCGRRRRVGEGGFDVSHVFRFRVFAARRWVVDVRRRIVVRQRVVVGVGRV